MYVRARARAVDRALELDELTNIAAHHMEQVASTDEAAGFSTAGHEWIGQRVRRHSHFAAVPFLSLLTRSIPFLCRIHLVLREIVRFVPCVSLVES
jgi:hypothetical protein